MLPRKSKWSPPIPPGSSQQGKQNDAASFCWAVADEVEALVRERLCQECSPEKRDRRVVNFMRRFDIDNDGVVRSRLAGDLLWLPHDIGLM